VSSINLPASVPAQGGGGGAKQLQSPFTVTMVVSGSCGTMTLHFDRGDGNGAQSPGFAGSYPNYTLLLPADNSNKWTQVAHTMTVYSGSSPLTPTYTFTVT
jgi:hypothetical protein